MLLVAGAGIALYIFLLKPKPSTVTSKNIESSNDKVITLLEKDFVTNYPKTPREVLKIYNRIQQCIYNESLNDDELKAVTEKMRELFDDDLLKSNSVEKQLGDLKAELKAYKKTKKTISNDIIDNNSAIQYKKIKNRECASVSVSYLLHDKEGYSKTYQEFLLRKDSKGNWKILGWQLIAPVDIQEE